MGTKRGEITLGKNGRNYKVVNYVTGALIVSVNIPA
jgi:hypothetical protein